ncbi:hypothetical protein M433DRAFT_161441, partial [Acidomyces richmondensis BFW]
MKAAGLKAVMVKKRDKEIGNRPFLYHLMLYTPRGVLPERDKRSSGRSVRQQPKQADHAAGHQIIDFRRRRHGPAIANAT